MIVKKKPLEIRSCIDSFHICLDQRCMLVTEESSHEGELYITLRNLLFSGPQTAAVTCLLCEFRLIFIFLASENTLF